MMSGSLAVPRPLDRKGLPALSSASGPPEMVNVAHGDDRTLPKIDVELVVVAVGDGAFLVVHGGQDDAAGRLHGARVGDVHHFRHTAGDGHGSAALHGHEQAAFADKALEIGEA